MNSLIPGYIAYVLLVGYLSVAAYWDFKTEKIPNWLTYPAVLGGLLYWTVVAGIVGNSPVNGLMASFLGFLAGAVPFLIVHLAGGVRPGDVKMVAGIGALTADWEGVIRIWMLGVFFLLIYCIGVMIRKGIVKKTMMRIWGAVMFVAARVKPDLESTENRIPVAVPFCAAGIVAGAEVLLKIRMPWN